MQRRYSVSLIVLILLALPVLAGCSVLPTSIIPATPTPLPQTATPMPTAAPVMEATQTPTPIPTEPPVVVDIDSNDTLGAFLIGPEELPLYFSLADEPGQSNCYDQCAAMWPPLLVEGDQALVASDDVAGELGVITRDDGGQQVTHEGVPLYAYAPDDEPGQPRGHGVAGKWWVRLNAARDAAATDAMLTTGLQVDGKAQLTPGAHALRVFENAGTDSEVVAYIEPADVLQITGGPQTVGSSMWYRVTAQPSGAEGWVNASYLIPYRDSVLPVGSRAELAPGVEGLHIREAAGADSPILGVVAIDDVVQVESGPEMVDGQRWYQAMNTTTGVGGWVHGRYLVPIPGG